MPKKPSLAAAPLHYRVEVADLHAHLFRVTLTIPRPDAQQDLTLPVWIPGSYMVREFSKNLQKLRARQGARTPGIQQLDKCSWRVLCASDAPLLLEYEVYAFDHSVRTAWLDASRGFFNCTSLCLRVEGQTGQPHELELVPPTARTGWQAATGLAPHKVRANGFGRYRAADYDELADSPVEMGKFWQGEFRAGGIAHRFIVAGAAPSFDGQRLLDDTRRICEAQIRFWHGGPGKRLASRPPHRNYLFMLNAVDEGYGGLEHRNSTALICGRRDLPRSGVTSQPEGYGTLLGLISHEYFHTWNVKRLRPVEFASYDYTRENHTELLWFFEGFTSYYDDVLLRRAGLLDDAGYLKLLNKTINQVMQTPGRAVQSVAQSSFDAWIKYYRQDENTPNATVSYYTKGALLALCLDLTLRAQGKTTLDEVMRALWLHCQAGPMSEADLLNVLEALGGRSFQQEIADWAHSTRELPLAALLKRHGVAVFEDPAQLAQALGLRVQESAGTGIQIKTVLRGGAAERAGMAAGDEWLGIEVQGQGWRIHRLDEIKFYAGTHGKLAALVARDRRLLRLDLSLPAAQTTWRLGIQDAALVKQWLGPQN
ncbi:MAG: peptidase M61 [Burkholderiaceae bacterium]|nr:peptidase M61 [Burkholderiaceae bacterium]